jgi:hypothetical protein
MNPLQNALLNHPLFPGVNAALFVSSLSLDAVCPLSTDPPYRAMQPIPLPETLNITEIIDNWINVTQLTGRPLDGHSRHRIGLVLACFSSLPNAVELCVYYLYRNPIIIEDGTVICDEIRRLLKKVLE